MRSPDWKREEGGAWGMGVLSAREAARDTEMTLEIALSSLHMYLCVSVCNMKSGVFTIAGSEQEAA